MRMEINGITYSYDDKEAISNVDICVKKGEFVGIIGPNGSGKSTVLKNAYRAIAPDDGEIILDGENLNKMKYKKTAQKMAVVGQENKIPFDFLVEEMVAMGRTPHKKLFDIDTQEDKRIVHHALEHVGMEDKAKKHYENLSGGEKQRVLLARTIAQESDFFILDEPTNHLDINYQMQIFDFIKRLKVTVLSAIHDLNMAALYCDRIYVMKNGEVVYNGTPEEVLTEDIIYEVFGVKSSVTKHPVTGKLSITFLPQWIIKEKDK
ncbi:MAG: ABC transporter ATP-binding protein [Clostridia bacterium]|nr:ABC transporter ATP-binding protein [Clostridia bacterium]